jgi:8-oxo-dGTP pyrophosphatase MutT (NUDIX family)
MRTRFEHSAGGVVVKQVDHLGSAADTGAAEVSERRGFDVILGSRRRRDGSLAWGLPKGLVEPGEEPEAAAVREVGEETGLSAEVMQPLGDVSYFYVWEGERVRKEVTFFLMRATGGDVSHHDDELEEVRWFSLREGIERADYRSERDVMERAAAALGASGS